MPTPAITTNTERTYIVGQGFAEASARSTARRPHRMAAPRRTSSSILPDVVLGSDKGVPIWKVAGLTNTSSATITKAYGHHAHEDLKSAANAVLGKSAERVPNGKEKGFHGNP